MEFQHQLHRNFMLAQTWKHGVQSYGIATTIDDIDTTTRAYNVSSIQKKMIGCRTCGYTIFFTFSLIFSRVDIEAECQDDYMKIRIGFNGTFTGLLYSAGEFLWKFFPSFKMLLRVRPQHVYSIVQSKSIFHFLIAFLIELLSFECSFKSFTQII